MQFQIKHLILWPRLPKAPRIITFHPGRTNIISGGSKTGKSAVIPIIDYCLCAGKCAIPVGVIRETCSWFGIVVSTVEGEKLFARREPGDQKQTSDMFICEGETVSIPLSIEKNATAEQAQNILNRLSGLSSLGMNPHSEGYAAKRAGFRDLMAFTFQPQNIVANPDVLFFKADTTEHREKLKAIFPYVLNAVSQQTLEDRWELDRLQQLLRRKEATLKAINSSVENWMAEALSWLQHGKELGLLPGSFMIPTLWPDILSSLRKLSSTNYRGARPEISAIEGVLKNLDELQNAETQEATSLSTLRQRLLEIKRLNESSRAYGEALYIQRDRLAVSNWIRTLSVERADALAAVAPEGAGHISVLCEALDGIELEIQSRVTISDKMDKERLRLRRLAEESVARLNDLRTQIQELEHRSKEAHAEIYRADQVERYLGRLEHAITLYEKSGEDAPLTAEVDDLRGKVNTIKSRISEHQIQQRIRQSLGTVENIAGQIIPTLDAEWPDAAINLVINELTLKVVQGTRMITSGRSEVVPIGLLIMSPHPLLFSASS